MTDNRKFQACLTAHAPRVDTLRAAAKAATTIKRYEGSWRRFDSWCTARGIDATAADERHIVVWLNERWDRRPSTLNIDANAIRWAQRRSRAHADPLVSRFLAAHSRAHGVAPLAENQVGAMTAEQLTSSVASAPRTRGMVGQAGLCRGVSCLALARLGVPLCQIARVGIDDVEIGTSLVTVRLEDLPASTTNRPHLFARTVQVSADTDEGRAITALHELAWRRRWLFGVTETHGDGRGAEPTGLRELATTRAVLGALRNQIKTAAQRARLGTVQIETVCDLDDATFKRLVDHLNPCLLIELRARAYVAALTAFGGRHSDIAVARVERARWTAAGVRIFIPRSKTDQDQQGAWRTIPHTRGHPSTCPACLVSTWVDEAGLTHNWLFPAMGLGGRIKTTQWEVEEAAAEVRRLVGPTEVRIGTHSCRKTHSTLRAKQGDEAWDIAATTGQSSDIILRHYIAIEDRFDVAQL